MITPDGRRVPVVYLDQRMLTMIAIEAVRANALGRPLAAAALDGEVYFRYLDDDVPRELRDLWRKSPGMMVPESAGYVIEEQELNYT
jgi:hypothetical protein